MAFAVRVGAVAKRRNYFWWIWMMLCLVSIRGFSQNARKTRFTSPSLFSPEFINHDTDTSAATSNDPEKLYHNLNKDLWQKYLWEQPDAFHTINQLLDRIFSSTTSPLLCKLDSGPLDETPSAYDHFYTCLFNANTAIELNEISATDSTCHPQHQGKRKSVTTSYRLEIRYRGNAFCGWQRQKDASLPAVQQVLEDWLQTLQSPSNGNPKPVDVRVSGRTDAGVHALAQICRFRSKEPIAQETIQRHLNQSPWASSLQCTSVTVVSSRFHPTFGATCRAYAYLMDWNDTYMGCSSVVAVQRLNALLEPLQHEELDYYSMSYGPVTTQNMLCTMFLARVCHVELVECDGCKTSSSDGKEPRPHSNGAIMFQLVANRFLRRMVRILVATALQHALDDSLWKSPTSAAPFGMLHPPPQRSEMLDILQQQNRRASAKPAPAHGLMLVGATVDEPC